MATTTNYGWATPDDTGLVKDGASAIRTLGSSIDTTTKALNPSTTLGDIEYRSSTANTNTRLGIGSTGQVLTVTSGVPSWTTPAGGGKVLQVVSTTYSTRTDIASTTFTDSGLTLSITPTLNTSKILILVTQGAINYRAAAGLGFSVRLMRGATAIYNDKDPTVIPSFACAFGQLSSGGETGIMLNYSYLDSPATTSSTTYKTQGAVSTTSNGQDMAFQKGSQASMILLEIGA